ncbi:MAG: hypothetical protein VB051_05035 [Candidatus Pelethousia sp.]|nr:hypothetical protein [Candidatus Pelethousia sp.]
MVQTERGLFSGCRCPDCGNACRDCMGSVEGPQSVEALRARFSAGVEASLPPKSEEELRELAEQPLDWRKLL